MRYRRFLTRPTILSGLALILVGCAGSPGRLNVDVGKALAECQRLGGVQQPEEITDDSDYREVAVDALAAIHKATQQDRRRTACEKRVAERYANAQRDASGVGLLRGFPRLAD